MNSYQFSLVLLNMIAASSCFGLETIEFSRVLFLSCMSNQASSVRSIYLPPLTIPEFFYLYDRGWKSNAKLLIIGLDNAGKSTLLDRVASGRMLQHPPTSQCRSKELSLGPLTFTAYDLGGHRQARRVWRDYFPAVDGIIFMVDVADAERFPEARAELESLLHDDNISDIPVVVLANKTDRKDAVGVEMVVNSLGLSIYRTGTKYTNKSELPGCPLEVFPCSILRQEGYGEGFRWLAHYVKQKE